MFPIKVLAGTGFLGTGFSEESFNLALAEGPDVIGCDAGSTDPGPYYLGEGQSITSREATKRDLSILLKGALEINVPLLIGSAGTSGCDSQVDWTIEIVEEIAREEGYKFNLASIYSEIKTDVLKKYFTKHKILPLEPERDLSLSQIEKSYKVVGQMGPHPFIKAMKDGAQVVIAGRSSDTSIYAAVPIMRGVNNGSVWHAAKIIECGAGCVQNRTHPDCMMAYIYDNKFEVNPPNKNMACTVNSVASHMLYENADPNILLEPSGFLDTSESKYMARDSRSVVVTGSRFTPSKKVTIKIEGVEYVGSRAIVIGGIDDPYILRNLEGFLADAKSSVVKKIAESLSLSEHSYSLSFRIYGNPDNPDYSKKIISNQVGILIEVIADTNELSKSIISIAWHTTLHQPIKEWSGLISNLALPFSPPDANMGPVYNFILNHVIEVEDPCELFQITHKAIG